MFSQDPQETDGKCYRRKRGEIGESTGKGQIKSIDVRTLKYKFKNAKKCKM